jgi:hypothetical protein
MEQLPPNIEQLLTDLESNTPMLRQAAAVKLGRMTSSNERIVAALEKAAAAGGTPDDGSAQAAAAAATALSTSAHREMLAQMGHTTPVGEQTSTSVGADFDKKFNEFDAFLRGIMLLITLLFWLLLGLAVVIRSQLESSLLQAGLERWEVIVCSSDLLSSFQCFVDKVLPKELVIPVLVVFVVLVLISILLFILLFRRYRIKKRRLDATM